MNWSNIWGKTLKNEQFYSSILWFCFLGIDDFISRLHTKYLSLLVLRDVLIVNLINKQKALYPSYKNRYQDKWHCFPKLVHASFKLTCKFHTTSCLKLRNSLMKHKVRKKLMLEKGNNVEGFTTTVLRNK